MMSVKLRSFSLAVIALGGLLFSLPQQASAFELLARRFGASGIATQKHGAHQKGAHQKGAHQKGAHQKGAHQKGVHQKGVHQKGASKRPPRQKLWGHQKGVSQKAPHQKLWTPHQKGASQKGGKGKGSVGTFSEGFGSTPDAGAPLPAPIAPSASAWLIR